MLKIKDISKQFSSTPVVDRVNLEIRAGEFFSLLGPSGCGKTTLLRMLAGFETPSSGILEMNGVNINDLPPNRRQFNMVFQRYALFPHLSVWENVAFGLKMKKIERSELETRVENALSLVRMENFGPRDVNRLSGGQQQRVALARALVNRPQVLLLDEPLSALDLKLREQMQWELLQLQRQLKITFIFVTHDQDEAMSLSDRIAVMNQGRIEQVGTPREVYDRPRTEFVARFIGSINTWRGTIQNVESNSCRVVLPGAKGGILASRPEGDFNVGQRVQVFVRPENIDMKAHENNETGVNALPGQVKHVVFRGAMTEFSVESFGLDYTVQIPSYEAQCFCPGDRVHIKWDQESCFVLPEAPL